MNSDNWSQGTEEVAWLELEVLRRGWLERCDSGQGTPALRDAAESLAVPMEYLESERGRRQLREVWHARPKS